ncbi:MAG: hypothetical protein Q9174_005262, partial [Haloplaca sp. 1 TL-2023]
MSTSPFFDTLLVLVVSPLITLTVVYSLLLIRSRIRRRRWRAPKSVVERLPVRIYHTMSCSSSTSSSSLASPAAASPTTPLLQSSPRSATSRSRPRSYTASSIGDAVSDSLDKATARASLKRRDTSTKIPAKKKAYHGKQVECVVCLEEYIDGQSRVMSLPCGHEFHAECITPWLTTRRRTCPICKGDVVRSMAKPSSNPSSPNASESRPTPGVEDADVQAQAAETTNDSPTAAIPIPRDPDDLERGDDMAATLVDDPPEESTSRRRWRGLASLIWPEMRRFGTDQGNAGFSPQNLYQIQRAAAYRQPHARQQYSHINVVPQRQQESQEHDGNDSPPVTFRRTSYSQEAQAGMASGGVSSQQPAPATATISNMTSGTTFAQKAREAELNAVLARKAVKNAPEYDPEPSMTPSIGALKLVKPKTHGRKASWKKLNLGDIPETSGTHQQSAPHQPDFQPSKVSTNTIPAHEVNQQFVFPQSSELPDALRHGRLALPSATDSRQISTGFASQQAHAQHRHPQIQPAVPHPAVSHSRGPSGRIQNATYDSPQHFREQMMAFNQKAMERNTNNPSALPARPTPYQSVYDMHHLSQSPEPVKAKSKVTEDDPFVDMPQTAFRLTSEGHESQAQQTSNGHGHGDQSRQASNGSYQFNGQDNQPRQTSYGSYKSGHTVPPGFGHATDSNLKSHDNQTRQTSYGSYNSGHTVPPGFGQSADNSLKSHDNQTRQSSYGSYKPGHFGPNPPGESADNKFKGFDDQLRQTSYGSYNSGHAATIGHGESTDYGSNLRSSNEQRREVKPPPGLPSQPNPTYVPLVFRQAQGETPSKPAPAMNYSQRDPKPLSSFFGNPMNVKQQGPFGQESSQQVTGFAKTEGLPPISTNTAMYDARARDVHQTPQGPSNNTASHTGNDVLQMSDPLPWKDRMAEIYNMPPLHFGPSRPAHQSKYGGANEGNGQYKGPLPFIGSKLSTLKNKYNGPRDGSDGQPWPPPFFPPGYFNKDKGKSSGATNDGKGQSAGKTANGGNGTYPGNSNNNNRYNQATAGHQMQTPEQRRADTDAWWTYDGRGQEEFRAYLETIASDHKKKKLEDDYNNMKRALERQATFRSDRSSSPSPDTPTTTTEAAEQPTAGDIANRLLAPAIANLRAYTTEDGGDYFNRFTKAPA